MEEAKKKKCYKRLIYKQNYLSKSQVFVAYSFWVICQNISRTFVDLCLETPYWCTDLVHQYSRRKSTKTSKVHFFHKSSFFQFPRELAYVRINMSSNTWNGYTAENQEERLFFSETAFLFWCHTLWKLGSSNCHIFEMKHATRMETCPKIFLFTFNLV